MNFTAMKSSKHIKLHTAPTAIKAAVAGLLAISMALTPPSTIAGDCCSPCWEGGSIETGIFSAGELSISTALWLVLKEYLNQLELTAKKISGATQKALSTQVVAKNEVETKKAEKEAKAATVAQENVVRAQIRFGPTTGQGFDPCGTLRRAKEAHNAIKNVGKISEDIVASNDNKAGTYTSVIEAEEKRLEHHNKHFCSEMDVKAENCSKVSEMPNGDMDLGVINRPMEPNSPAYEAGKSSIRNAIGQTHGELDPDVTSSPDGALAQRKKAEVDLIRSAVEKALSRIMAKNVRQPENGGKSANEALQNVIETYMGGRSREWSNAMAVQDARGLLLEAIKLEGTGTWMRFHQYKSLMEAEYLIALQHLNTMKPAEQYHDNLVRKSNMAGG